MVPEEIDAIGEITVFIIGDDGTTKTLCNNVPSTSSSRFTCSGSGKGLLLEKDLASPSSSPLKFCDLRVYETVRTTIETSYMGIKDNQSLDGANVVTSLDDPMSTNYDITRLYVESSPTSFPTTVQNSGDDYFKVTVSKASNVCLLMDLGSDRSIQYVSLVCP